MDIYKKESKVKDKILTVELPEEFRDMDVEVIIRIKKDIEKELLVDKIKINTKKWKFDREEIHER